MDLKTQRLIWLDLETGGVDPVCHQITQVGAMATLGLDFDTVSGDERYEQKMQLVEGRYTEEALKVQGHTEERWAEAIQTPAMLDEFGRWCSLHTHQTISKKGSKYQVAHLAGFNLRFDCDFLNATCKRNGSGERGYWLPISKWRGGWIDVLDLALWVRAMHGHNYDDMKLETICKYYGIPIEAHDALGDVKATIELAKVLTRLKVEDNRHG